MKSRCSSSLITKVGLFKSIPMPGFKSISGRQTELHGANRTCSGSRLSIHVTLQRINVRIGFEEALSDAVIQFKRLKMASKISEPDQLRWTPSPEETVSGRCLARPVTFLRATPKAADCLESFEVCAVFDKVGNSTYRRETRREWGEKG